MIRRSWLVVLGAVAAPLAAQGVMVAPHAVFMNSRSNSGAEGIRYLRDGSFCGYSADDGREYGFRRLPVCMRVEVEDNAVAQNGRRDVLHVLQ